MPVYHLTENAIEPLPETSFAQSKVKERGDLQRLLRANIGIVAPDVLVISEEFAEWEDSKRRIDLLGIDRDANLVVIELKRDDDGSHMELQAIRYAAMVSGMTFARAVTVYQDFLDRHAAPASGSNGSAVATTASKADARAMLLAHLNWDEPREDDFAQDVRIVLVSSDFSKEITTAVLWLNTRDLDIRCVRLKPYVLDARIIVNAEQVIPLPEAEAYTIQIKQKEQAAKQDRAERGAPWQEFWRSFLPRAAARTPRFASIAPGTGHWIGAASGTPGLEWNYASWQRRDRSGAELYIDRPKAGAPWNKAVFDHLHARREAVESAFGAPLAWLRLNDGRASRIVADCVPGSIRLPREQWLQLHDGMVDVMVRLEGVLSPYFTQAVQKADSASTAAAAL